MHVEAKKSQDEKDIMARKYEETIKSINETHQNRMKALVQQHENATEALIDQFKREISALKASHKAHIDRLISEAEEQSSSAYAQIDQLKQKHKENTESLSIHHTKNLIKLKEELETHYLNNLNDQKERFEREKHEFCEKAVKERDAQIKTLINKLYEDCRKDWKVQENKLNEEIKALRTQIDRMKRVKSEENLQANRFLQPAEEISEIQMDKNENDYVQVTPVQLEINEFKDEASQTEVLHINTSTQTENASTVQEKINELEGMHNTHIQIIETKVTEILKKKNTYINTLEHQIHQLITRTKELEALFNQLKC